MDAVSHMLLAGIADRYEVERELGRGGMATVYLARDVRHDRHVAVKVMRPDVSASVGTERFLREVRVAARLNHPHILALHDSGRLPLSLGLNGSDETVASELLYYVMPYVRGESLRDRLRREGQLPIPDAVRIASQVADALSFAHAQGVIHRDIKPENVLLAGYSAHSTDSWHAVVADFGIARLLAETGPELTGTGISLGTPAYMSPEQATGEHTADARADVYSLGCLLYEVLVGEPPFTGPNVSAIIARHLTAPIPSMRAVRPTVPVELEALVHHALAKLPADRIATAAAFKAALDGIRTQAPTDGPAAPPIGAPPPAQPRAGRRPAWSRWAIVAAAGTAVALGMAVIARDRFARAREAPPPVAPAAPALERTRIAVAPFRIVGDSSDAYLADASTGDLISALSRVGSLRVLAQSAMAAMDSARRSPLEIARANRAGSLVEGTFYRRGDAVRFAAVLVDATTGEQLWNASYGRRAHELAGLQDSVAAAIAGRLAAFDPARSASGAVTQPKPVSGAAYDAYLRGMFLMSRVPVPPRTVADSAIRLFERAIALDSSFALAHVAVARVYNILFFNYEPDPAWEERAFIEIEKALALDPNLAEAYDEKASLTWTRANGFPHVAAAKLYRKAIALQPSFVDPHQSLGSLYMHVGLFDRALAEYDSALTLDPTTRFVPVRVARIHWYQGKYEQALREFDAQPNRGTSFVAERALVLNYLGRGTEALTGLDSALVAREDPQNYDIQAARAVVLATGGNRDAAHEAIRAALRSGTEASHFHHAAYSIAEAYALLGERGKALEFLRRTAADGMPCYPLFLNDPHLRTLRGDPEFGRFMSDLQRRFQDLATALD